MTPHQYLQQILNNQAMSNLDLNKLRRLRDEIEGVLKNRYGDLPRFYYGGSYGKKTMIRESYDLDIVIYFPFNDNKSLKVIYNDVYQTLSTANYVVTPKTVSLQLPYQDGFHIDVVPGKAQDKTYYYASLYKNGEDSWMQTSLKTHIDYARKYRDIIKLMKLWRLRYFLDWKTFAVEQTVIRALNGKNSYDYAQSLTEVFEFIKNQIKYIRLVDPANTNNIIEMSDYTRILVEQAATKSLAEKYWENIIR